MVGPLPPKTVASPLREGSITPRRGAQGLGCMEAGKAGLLPQALGSSLTFHQPWPRTVNKHQSIHPRSPRLSAVAICVSHLPVCLSLSLSPSVHGPTICPPYVYPFFPSSFFITSFKEETVCKQKTVERTQAQ